MNIGTNSDSGLRGLHRRFSWILAGLSVGSVVLGVVAWAVGIGTTGVVVNVAASHFVIWGLIDVVFAGLGLWATRPSLPERTAEQSAAAKTGLIKSLKFNAILNWIWVGSGVGLLALASILAATGSDSAIGTLGHGVGVTIQGGLLFAFDRWFLPAVERV
jgi:hypothetical protein